MFQQLMQEARAKFGDPPRKFTNDQARAIRTAPPEFMHADPGDPLWLPFRQRQAIFTHGELVWGQIVQANSILYDEADPHDAPAAYIYSLDPHFDEDVLALAEIADTMFNIRGEQTDNPRTQKIANMLGDGYVRNLLVQVPYELTDGRDVYYTCGVIPRKYLPIPRLVAPLFPLIVVPGRTEATWVLPKWWWPNELVEMWIDAVSH